MFQKVGDYQRWNPPRAPPVGSVVVIVTRLGDGKAGAVVNPYLSARDLPEFGARSCCKESLSNSFAVSCGEDGESQEGVDT